MVQPEVRELEPGDFEAWTPTGTCRVLVPAGVGLPGVGDVELVEALVAELADRGELPDVVDVSALLGRDPALLDAVAARVEG